jgi:predicted lactoylglutathione lyase
MKHFLFSVLASLAMLSASAQNGGQSEQNNAVRLTFMGQIGGSLYVKVTNKLLVASSFKFDNTVTTSSFNLGALKDTLINMGAKINGIVKVKNTNPLPFVDNGWVEMCLVVSPLKFVSSSAVYLKESDEILVTFTVADVSNIDRIVIEASIDGGKTVRQVGLAWPFVTPMQQTYKVKISVGALRAMK